MENCLLTKLNATVNNINCDRFNKINVFVNTKEESKIIKISLTSGTKYSVDGQGYRSTEQGEVYPNPGTTLAANNWFNGTGAYKVILDKTIDTLYITGLDVGNDNCIVKLSNLFGISALTGCTFSACKLEGDLMEIGFVNDSLSFLVFQVNSVYGSSSDKLEDVLANYQHANGTFEFLFASGVKNYMGNNLTFNGNVIPVERWIATYSNGTIVVTRKTDSTVLGTYNGTSWSYPS